MLCTYPTLANKLLVPRLLFLCAALLSLPRITVAQPFSDPLPAWYTNGASGGLIATLQNPPLSINWRNSYIYRGPSNAALYWYAQVEFRNIGSQPLPISCDGRTDPKKFLELMSGTPNAGYVIADQTFCQSNPNFKRVIEPEGAYYEWAIFHNVPWKISQSRVSIGWAVPGSSAPVFSAPVDPWSSPISVPVDSRLSPNPVPFPGPAECPPELANLQTCIVGQPQGNTVVPSNLIVLVHGCCTDEGNDLGEFKALADTMIAETIRNRTTYPRGSRVWEFVVWSWTHCRQSDHSFVCTPKRPPLQSYFLPAVFFLADPILVAQLDLDSAIAQGASGFLQDAATAYKNAPDSGAQLANAIENAASKTKGYVNIHLIGHSAGAKLIDVAAKQLADKYKGLPHAQRPFIHLTFLDAYTPDSSTPPDTITYGSLPDYPEHFSEHYVDKEVLFPHTNSNLKNAYNFDITDFSTSTRISRRGRSLDQARDWPFGHQWPRYWYEKSVTAGWYLSGFRYGYPLSREGGNSDSELNALAKTFPAGSCEQLIEVSRTPTAGCPDVP